MNRALALLALPLAASLLLAGCSPKKETCLAPNIECGGKCLDPTHDPANCGNCGVTCGAGQTCCGACTDVTADPDNCGACGSRCPTGGSCSSSTCTCPPAQPTVCGAGGSNRGACVDLASDPRYCGSCTQACWGPLVLTSEATCSSGACSCTGGATACAGESPECRSLQTDPTACGGCGTVCPPHATCASGACACGDSSYPDRCPVTGPLTRCVSFATDAANCGGCGAACPPSAPACSSGHCCPSGQGFCAGSCVDTRSSTINCGGCGHACGAGQICSSGTCTCGNGGLVCGGTCCVPGAGCCGSAESGTCMTAHSNGLGGTFFDCSPLFSAGNPWTQVAASAAADAWHFGTTSSLFCSGNCLARQVTTTSSCAVWCWDGSFAGHVTSGGVDCGSLCTNFLLGATPTWQ